jgi:ribosomal protein S27E
MSLIYLVISAQAAAKALMRVCPACGKKQVVESSDKNQTVSCRHCGKPIAPPKAG